MTVLVSVEGRSGRGGAPELPEVVGQADELPFGWHLGEASQGELAETVGVFDLTAVLVSEDRAARLVPFVFGRSHARSWFAAYGPDAASV